MMNKPTPLEIKLLDEYYRCERNLATNDEAISECVKGSLQRQIINEKLYHYLVWRDGKEVKKKYIKMEDAPGIYFSIKRRKELESNKKVLIHDIKILEKALGKDLINE